MKRSLRIAAASLIDSVLVYSLLVLMLLVAIPYGTVEPWWKALFQSLVFVLAGLAVIEKWLRSETGGRDSVTSHAGNQHGKTALLLPVSIL